MDSVVFFHPPWQGLPSGGHRYNGRLIEMAALRNWPLWAVPVTPYRPGLADDSAPSPASAEVLEEKVARLRLWDSLLLGRYVSLRSPGLRGSDALLMHYLPSLNPLLDPDARSAARLLEDRAAAGARSFIVTGSGLGDVLQSRYPDRPCFVCEPGVDDDFVAVRRQRAQERGSGSSVELLTVANLLPAKGHAELLCILQGLPRSGWRWHIVGSGDADPEFTRAFRREAQSLMSSGRILLHGPLSPPALARLMAHMAVFVSASHFESYGMAVAEAVAAGLPVVATDVGDAKRLIRDGVNGYLIPIGAWKQFAARLEEIIDDASLRRTLGEADGGPVRSWDETFADFVAACGG